MIEYCRRAGIIAGLFAVLVMCLIIWNQLEVESDISKEILTLSGGEAFKITERDSDVSMEECTEIDLENGTDTVISLPGTYCLCGSTDRTVVIDVEDEAIHLILDGADIHALTGPAIWVKSSGKCVITLNEDSENTLQDGGSYYGNKEADAALFCNNDLTINGSGSLNICGYYKNAIHTKDVLKVVAGKVFAKSKEIAVYGNDGVLIRDTDLTIASEEIGIRAKGSGENSKGDIEISNSKLSLVAGEYGIVTDSDLFVRESQMYLNSVIENYRVQGRYYSDVEID